MARWSSQTVHHDIREFTDVNFKKRLRKQRLIIAGVLLVVAACIATAAKPTYRAIRTYQINRNLKAAQAAASEKDWGEARNLARSVLLARSTDLAAFRVWFRAISEMEEPRAYLAAMQLFTHPTATPDDRMEAFRVMSTQGPQALAFGAFASLPPEVREGAEARASLSEVLILRGPEGIVFAEKMLREATGLERSPRARLALVRVLCASRDPNRVREARDLFVQLTKENLEAEALEALRILGETPGGLASGEPLPPLVPWVEQQTSATSLDHLLALHPTMGEAPEQKEKIFAAAVERFRNSDPAVLGDWLVRHEQFALAADALEDIARDHPEAFVSRVHALLRLKKYEEVNRLLGDPPATTKALKLELIRVAVAREQGDRTAETMAWNGAMTQAALDTSKNHFLEVARFAKLYKVSRVEEDAWVAAIRVGWGRLPVYRDVRPLLASLARQNRTFDMLAVTRSLMRYENLNPELHSNFLYLGVLHEVINPGVALGQMQALIDQHPEMPELYSAAGIAALLDGRPEKLLGWLEQLDRIKKLPPMMRWALEGTALVINGQPDEGRKLLEKVNFEQFLDQENAIFRKLLMRQQVAGLPMPSLDQLPLAEPPKETAAWLKAVERMERERASEVLPALPMPKVSGEAPVDKTAVKQSFDS
jgi:hypothetical protein